MHEIFSLFWTTCVWVLAASKFTSDRATAITEPGLIREAVEIGQLIVVWPFPVPAPPWQVSRRWRYACLTEPATAWEGNKARTPKPDRGLPANVHLIALLSSEWETRTSLSKAPSNSSDLSISTISRKCLLMRAVAPCFSSPLSFKWETKTSVRKAPSNSSNLSMSTRSRKCLHMRTVAPVSHRLNLRSGRQKLQLAKRPQIPLTYSWVIKKVPPPKSSCTLLHRYTCVKPALPL